jgi:hypothetical protein
MNIIMEKNKNKHIYGSYGDFSGEKLKSHVKATWTYPDHFAHDNYQRGHLPQVCIVASGWKAKILAFIFRAK